MTDARAPAIQPSPTYANIECLRAVAALAVVACHVSILGGYDATSFWARLAGFGAVGVDLFFVISGLVITSAALRLHPTAGFARTFWLRRAARLLPLYLLTSIAFLILVDASALTSGHALFQLSTHLLMIHNWFPTTASAINPVTWTLGVEVQLYLLSFAAVSLGLLSAAPPPRLAFVAIGGMVLALVWRAAVWWLATGDDRAFWMNQPFGMLDGYCLGAVLACVVNRIAISARVARLLTACGIAWIALSFALLPHHPAQFWQSPTLPMLLRTTLAIGFFLLVLAAVKSDNVAPIGRLKTLFIWLGKYSYGIYLWHLIVIMLAIRAGYLDWPLALITLVATIGLAAMSFHWVEQPVQRWARAW